MSKNHEAAFMKSAIPLRDGAKNGLKQNVSSRFAFSRKLP
jgi:hypothetical protein